MRKVRLEPLNVVAAKPPTRSELAPGADGDPSPRKERLHMVDDTLAITEDLHLAMLRLGNEARRRGQHVHAAGPLHWQGVPRLVQLRSRQRDLE
mmetsp:Transcript_72379/g.187801  ORF Transcript_72379/g.187801 Transcript_72379/m.187801 type:complete len:94 (+) Transcript_72379:1-282(+)